jgi:nucleoid-associated protein YgaU
MTYNEFVRDARQIGEGVVIPDTVRLEQNKQAYAQQIVSSPAFVTRFPQNDAATYVTALYASAGVTPVGTEQQQAIDAYNTAGTATEKRVAAFRKVADSGSVRDAEFRPAFVLMEYFGYLRVNPDQPGYNFWLTKLNQFNGSYIDAEMVKSFIVSGEYRERFIP